MATPHQSSPYAVGGEPLLGWIRDGSPCYWLPASSLATVIGIVVDVCSIPANTHTLYISAVCSSSHDIVHVTMGNKRLRSDFIMHKYKQPWIKNP